MAETSWEAHARRRTWLWKWPPIILLVIIAAGIIIYNNRDVISGTADPQKDSDSIEAFSLALSDDDSAAAGRAETTVPEPPRKRVAPEKATKPRIKKDSIPVERHVTAQTPLTVQKEPERPERSKPPVSSESAADSVEIGEVPCSVLNRRDLTVRIVLVVYCDKAKRAEVLFKRDALAVMTRNVIRTRDLEQVRFDMLEPELLRSMNLVFDKRTITGIAFRSVKIEKASHE
jgi:hypothetical protein